MNIWTLLDTADVPGGGGTLRLLRRGDEFSINLGPEALMTSRRRGSEEALARLGCAGLEDRECPRVLIGGLGMGFTLRAALALLGRDAEIVVAELVPAVVRWGRGPLAALFGGCLDDPRVSVFEGDVGRLIRAGPAAYDSILLDVDNGPDGLTRETNDGLYAPAGLRAAWAALQPGGIFAVWSATGDPAFTLRLRKLGFAVAENKVRAHGTKGPRHMIWTAVRPPATSAGVGGGAGRRSGRP